MAFGGVKTPAWQGWLKTFGSLKASAELGLGDPGTFHASYKLIQV
jgi:hypothetical protein